MIDALALGVPPVAFAVGGLPELVVTGLHGLLVLPDDTAAFAGAVTELVTDASFRATLARAGPA